MAAARSTSPLVAGDRAERMAAILARRVLNIEREHPPRRRCLKRNLCRRPTENAFATE